MKNKTCGRDYADVRLSDARIIKAGDFRPAVSAMEVKKNLFTLPAPLSHFRGIVGSAHIVPDAWRKFGVMVTLETGQLFCMQTFDSKGEADDLAASLNRCQAD